MSKQKSSREDRDESLEIQNNTQQAGVGEGLGDRSASGLNSPGRKGVGGGVNADDLRMPTSGAQDLSLDENEDSYGTGNPQRSSARMPKDSSDTPARADGADRDLDEGSADSKGKDDFMDIDA